MWHLVLIPARTVHPLWPRQQLYRPDHQQGPRIDTDAQDRVDKCREATTVRQAWLSEAFLTRTAPPKGAETFLAVAVAYGEHTEDYHRLYLKLVRGSQDQDDAYRNASSKIEARISAATPRQALMLALALIVCEWESTTSRNTWRHPGERDRRYLTALIGWGYKPSDVEQLILADTTQAETTDPEVPDKDIQQVEVEQVEVEQVEVEYDEDERVEDEPDQDGDDGD